MKKFVYVIISALFIAACNIGEMEFDDLQLTPISGPFVFQLGETSYIMRDLIGNQTGDSLNFQEDSTSLLTLVYYDTITYNTPDEFIRINDIVQTGATNPPAYPGGAARQETFTASFDLTYDPEDGEVIDELYYLTGDITIVTTSDIMANVDYEYTIQNTTNVNNGDPVVLNGTVNNGTNKCNTISHQSCNKTNRWQ